MAGVLFSDAPPSLPVNQQVILDNHGTIIGAGAVDDVCHYSDGSINNYGTLIGKQAGISVITSAGITTTITNAAGALITGPLAAILAESGIVHVVNRGTIVGDVDFIGPVSGSVTNSGHIRGSVRLTGGNDLFNGQGGISGAIFAGAGNDRIVDGNGTAVVHMGSGNDTVTAGPGTDRLIFESALAGQVDRIAGFTPGTDKIVLSQTDFAGIGPVGHALAAADFRFGAHPTTASQHILYNPANGFLSYDADGNGPTSPIHFATLLGHPALTHADFLVVA
jgi:Ca2+-binding RTX toxin-like protein